MTSYREGSSRENRGAKAYQSVTGFHRPMTQEIPAMAVFREGRRINAGRLGRDLQGTADYLDLVSGPDSRIDRKTPFLAVDVRGIAEGEFRADVIKNIKVKKYNVWLMTCVRDADDLFDVFNSEADTVLVPCHLTSYDDLEDMLSVSESIIPAIIVSGLMAPGQRSPEDILSRLVSLGFDSAAVIDTDGIISAREWARLSGIAEVLPYSESAPVMAGRRFISAL